MPADFNNGQSAHNAASAGDTLYFESSPTAYATFTLRKQLTIMGLGAFLNNYSGNQLPGAINANLSGITIKPGASRTEIIGLQIGVISVDTVSNIKLERLYIINSISSSAVTNSIIRNSYLTSVIINNSSNFVISNNIILNGLSSSSSTLINVFQNSIPSQTSGSNFTLTNNILGPTNITNSTVSYNIFSTPNYNSNGLAISSGGNNLFSQNTSNVFVSTGSGDLFYQLKSGSPAFGESSTGGDCGATGGANPYIFNGLQPSIPSIYKLEVPGVVTGSTLPVIISTKSNN